MASPPPGIDETPLDLTVHRKGDVATIIIDGEVDHHTCETLRRAAREALAAGTSSVTFECSALSFLDAGGLRVFCDVLAATEERGGTVVLEGATASTRRLLEVTGLRERLLIR